ncbi:hypothetical protein FVEN_g12711 [Fusarium venenatum]|uniref:Uncharacterized protein n=1 Tax=Fusarium venenatum TaxID=56646 RepID=A0A2L2SW40_9HYPO|nr:uncharacterized protein FVRRES_06340 [Fusarium venenatum]KAG8359480.1 hypothetical protein FVEN_g12711 [Fusarium venenatum]CEI61904.1 unnamed protein product [Fusarium venenatum]
MSDAAKPMLVPHSYIELDTEYQSHGSEISQSIEETSHAHSKPRKSYRNSFNDAWQDLSTTPHRVKQWQRVTSHTRSAALKPFKNSVTEAWHDLLGAPHRLKMVQWRRLGLRCIITVWTLSLLALTICLALSLPMRLDEYSPCPSNGDFQFTLSDTIYPQGTFNYWAPSGFFDITLAWGRFDFSTVKLIDVAWDLVVGRGGQAIMALVSWRVFAEYLQVSLATTPATYTTVWLLRFQQSSSAFSTWQLASAFFRRGLASKTAMVFTIQAAIFTMAFPTLIASMTGYTPKNEPFIVADNGRLNPLNDLIPAAYVIHDGDRVKGLTKEYGIPWRSDSSLSLTSAAVSYCSSWNRSYVKDDCELQLNVSEYIQEYGFKIAGSEVSGERTSSEIRNTTDFGGQEIDWPPLSISVFYLPGARFYWNTSAADEFYDRSGDYEKPFRDVSNAMYLMDDRLYSPTELNRKGTCQPMKEDVGQQSSHDIPFP